MMEAERYIPTEDGDYIPISEWGKDHWSTLAYFETRAVDYKGKVDNKHMRCNARLHRIFARSSEGKDYPTRLASGKKQEGHDDWSCAEDMAAAGLVFLSWKNKDGSFVGGGKAHVELADLGWRVAALLRQHKANGGAFGNFVYTH